MWKYMKSVRANEDNFNPDETWEVGYYDPRGIWRANGTFPHEYLAKEEVHYLNGGNK